jgi:hypothetical protein
MARASWNTAGTGETPFLDSATHKYCRIAVTNTAFPLNTRPAFCTIDNNNCSDNTFDRNSCDLHTKPTNKLHFRNSEEISKLFDCILFYFGSGIPSGSGFMDSLQSALNTRKASFCRILAKWASSAPPTSTSPILSCNHTHNDTV